MEDTEGCPIEISHGGETLIFNLKVFFASVGVVTSLLAILSLIHKCNVLLFRIILYTMIANGLQITFQLVEILPVHNLNGTNVLKNGSNWERACKSFGFLDQVTAWMGHLCMTWVISYLINRLKTKNHLETAQWSKEEIVGMAICFLVPFVFNWIPFLDNYYGFSGGWCWIKMTASDTNCNITEGLVYIILFYYGPLLLFVLFNLVSCVFLFFGFFRDPKFHSKEFLFVLLYPFCYGMLFMIVAISRLYSIWRIQHSKKQSYSWWMAHAMADPLRIIFPSTLVFVSMLCSTVITKCRLPKAMGMVNGEDEGTNSDDGEKTKLVRHT